MAVGDPGPQERACLANLRECEAGVEFARFLENRDALLNRPKRRPAWWWDATPAVQRAWLREQQ